LWLDGLTTLVTPALKPAAVLLLLLPPPPLLLQAARARAPAAPTAASPVILRLGMK
jgi:hypothetical protein